MDTSFPGFRAKLARSGKPEGTLLIGGTQFECPIQNAPGTLIDFIAGRHVFVLERTATLALRFTHATPGGGTHVAEVDASALDIGKPLDYWLRWRPRSCWLDVVDPASGRRVESGESIPASYQFIADGKGGYCQLGSEGIRVGGFRFVSSGRLVMGSPAIGLWQDTLEAARMLLEESSNSPLREVVLANSCLQMLTTGFEVYCKERFIELDGEGVVPDILRTAARFLSKEERNLLKEGTFPIAIQKERKNGGSGIAELTRRVNFQDLEPCRRAYALAYGVRFGVDLGLKNTQLDRLKTLLRYRHRIAHVSPFLALLNDYEVPPAEPEFSSRTFADEAMQKFDEFITSLHDKTLMLR